VFVQVGRLELPGGQSQSPGERQPSATRWVTGCLKRHTLSILSSVLPVDEAPINSRNMITWHARNAPAFLCGISDGAVGLGSREFRIMTVFGFEDTGWRAGSIE
jgi:hypothetical protein